MPNQTASLSLRRNALAAYIKQGPLLGAWLMRGVQFSTLRAEPSVMAGPWCQCTLVLVFLVSSTFPSRHHPSLQQRPFEDTMPPACPCAQPG